MTLESFFSWWNLLFELVFLLALIYTLLMAFGMSDAHGAAEHDAPAEISAEYDSAAGIEHTVGQAPEAAHEAGVVTRAVSFLGVGRVPFSIVITTFCALFGFTGWTANQLFGALGLPPLLFVWLSLGVAFGAAIGLTRGIAYGLARVLPSTESYGVEKSDLVGRLGEVRYPISATFGAAQVRDQYGNLHQVDCRVPEDHPEIPAGTRVALLGYDPVRGVFTVLTEEELEDQVRSR